jgi:hypothetical protein
VIVCNPAPGMSNLIVSWPDCCSAVSIARRSEPAFASLASVTVIVAACADPAAAATPSATRTSGAITANRERASMGGLPSSCGPGQSARLVTRTPAAGRYSRRTESAERAVPSSHAPGGCARARTSA